MKNFRVAVDSGAYSLYNEKFSPGRQKGTQSIKDLADYDYVKTPQFKKYLEGYIEFLTEHKDELEMYVGLDIIYNAKATQEVQAYIESCGLDPIPVFHYGEPWSVLKKYIDKYDYIGVGGLGQGTSVRSYVDFGDKIFSYVCDKHGLPTVRIHGFAMTSIQLMKRYPWYSCDSSTWSSLSRNGWVRFPRLTPAGDYDWLRKPISWRFTERARHAPVHVSKQSEMATQFMERYLHEMWGFSLYDVIIDPYFARDVANAGHTLLSAEALKKYYEERWGYTDGGKVYLAGHTGDRMTVPLVKREFTRVRRALPSDLQIHYLASHYYPRQTDIALAAKKPSTRKKLK